MLPADNTWTMCGKNYLGEALRRKGEYERSLDLLQQSLAGTTLHYTIQHYTIPYYTILYYNTDTMICVTILQYTSRERRGAEALGRSPRGP